VIAGIGKSKVFASDSTPITTDVEKSLQNLSIRAHLRKSAV
jgi:hypothetical protein